MDRGELDKLIERSGTIAPTRAGNGPDRSQPQFADSNHDYGQGPHGSRKQSWLSEIFD